MNAPATFFDKILTGVADLRYESSFVGFLKPRPKLTFGWVQGCQTPNDKIGEVQSIID
ncbi:hypothetical protein [Microcystis sp. LSC13-02]|uniref:hypothetical protein n=1 Tax=Microcystis sp. LSC13-02 TaxID=1895004 RepID=UPI00257FE762|nr:hypothetical protein [Microcystis sp. LSC13-02]